MEEKELERAEETTEAGAEPELAAEAAAETTPDAVSAEEKTEIREARDVREREPRERGERPAKKGFKKQSYKKVCLFCQEKSAKIDYKEVSKLRKYISEGGKILPRRMTGTCARHQRELAVAIKRARVAALLPFKAD